MFWQAFGSSEGEFVYLKCSLFFPIVYLDLIKTLLHPKNPYLSAEPSYTPAGQHSLLHCLVSSTNWLRVRLISSFRSLIRVLNRTNNEPWGAPLVAIYQWGFFSIHHHSWAQPSASSYPSEEATTGCQLLQKNAVRDAAKGLLSSRQTQPSPHPPGRSPCRTRRSGWPSRTCLSYMLVVLAGPDPRVDLCVPHDGTPDEQLHGLS